MVQADSEKPLQQNLVGLWIRQKYQSKKRVFDLCDVDVMGCSKVHGGSCRKSSRARQDLLRCMGHRWLERNIICVGATLGCLEAPRWTWGLQLLRQAEGESLEISHSVDRFGEWFGEGNQFVAGISLQRRELPFPRRGTCEWEEWNPVTEVVLTIAQLTCVWVNECKLSRMEIEIVACNVLIQIVHKLCTTPHALAFPFLRSRHHQLRHLHLRVPRQNQMAGDLQGATRIPPSASSNHFEAFWRIILMPLYRNCRSLCLLHGLGKAARGVVVFSSWIWASAASAASAAATSASPESSTWYRATQRWAASRASRASMPQRQRQPRGTKRSRCCTKCIEVPCSAAHAVGSSKKGLEAGAPLMQKLGTTWNNHLKHYWNTCSHTLWGNGQSKVWRMS